MSRVGLEPTIPVFERAKTVHAVDSAATVVGHRKGNYRVSTMKRPDFLEIFFKIGTCFFFSSGVKGLLRTATVHSLLRFRLPHGPPLDCTNGDQEEVF
jgi:hypothetical protein